MVFQVFWPVQEEEKVKRVYIACYLYTGLIKYVDFDLCFKHINVYIIIKITVILKQYTGINRLQKYYAPLTKLK